MLTTTEEKQFNEEGFVMIPSFIPEPLLKKLQLLFDELMDFSDTNGKAIHENNGQKFITNLEEICRRGNLAALELLGYPPLLEIAKQICGDDFFMKQEFAVIKNLGDDMPVLWHLDMLHERKGKCFTVGFYLDGVEAGDGALKVVPGSHVSAKTICELSKESFIEAPAQAGDILIHDMMLAHSSEPLRKNKLRRVIYFEFLSAAHVRAENIYGDELIERRKKMIPLAMEYYAAQQKRETEIAESGAVVQSNAQEALAFVYSDQIRARPSAYCLEFHH
ncbi:MAG: phytanoyl-CoA dioxygenase family protein [Chitinophagaceae bacterium]|nr:phytanoyl-CoA dioxygenase family protein [Chitinophagaceae bacterium]